MIANVAGQKPSPATSTSVPGRRATPVESRRLDWRRAASSSTTPGLLFCLARSRSRLPACYRPRCLRKSSTFALHVLHPCSMESARRGCNARAPARERTCATGAKVPTAACSARPERCFIGRLVVGTTVGANAGRKGHVKRLRSFRTPIVQDQRRCSTSRKTVMIQPLDPLARLAIETPLRMGNAWTWGAEIARSLWRRGRLRKEATR